MPIDPMLVHEARTAIVAVGAFSKTLRRILFWPGFLGGLWCVSGLALTQLPSLFDPNALAFVNYYVAFSLLGGLLAGVLLPLWFLCACAAFLKWCFDRG
jgi:fluoride ion exporter CrcB/FEX